MNIKETIIPGLKQNIIRNRQVAEAQLSEAFAEVGLQHEQLEGHGRRLNLVWNGREEVLQSIITEFGGRREFENSEQLFRDFLVTSLKFDKAYVDSMLFRDVHRLPKGKRSRGPPPVIVAFVCQKHRNDVLAAAKHLANTGFSIKSDLPKRLNDLRSDMLKERRELKQQGKVVRLVERNYLPILQEQNTISRKWAVIWDIKGRVNNMRAPAADGVLPPVVGNSEEDT